MFLFLFVLLSISISFSHTCPKVFFCTVPFCPFEGVKVIVHQTTFQFKVYLTHSFQINVMHVSQTITFKFNIKFFLVLNLSNYKMTK